MQSLLASPAPMATVAVTGVTRALRDKLSELEDSVQKLEAANKIKYAPAEDLGALQDHIFDRQNDHERTISALRRDLGQLRATLENQTCELSQLRQLVDALTDGVLTERADDHIPAAPVVKTEHEEQTSQRDNLYNNAVRSAFLVALGLPFSARYNDLATIPSTANGGAWVELRAEVAGEKATRVLRPDFAKPWTQNALGWRVELIGFVRAKVPQLQPLFNNAFMKSKTDDEISSKLSALYKTLKSKHNKLTAYGTSAPTTSSAVTPPSTEANTAQSARRLARKKRKSQGRRKVLLDPQVYDQDSVASEWRWLVDEPAYMSTDESTDDEQDQQVGVIDPNSDDERKPRTRKQIPWITRPPTYRNAIMAIERRLSGYEMKMHQR
ncbi:hypothetical protein HDZ31DRAFT_68166 [Schizophyllum fasciatum]